MMIIAQLTLTRTATVRVAVGPGNAHCIRQVSLQRGTCGPPPLLLLLLQLLL